MSDLKLGHCQIALKPCSSSRGHSFASIFMKFNQNVSLDDDQILVKFGFGHVRSKTRSQGKISLKRSPSRGQFCYNHHETESEYVLMMPWSDFKMGHVR